VKTVPLRSGRNKVSLTIQVIEKLAWSRIELVDRREGLLQVVDNDSPPADLEELGTGQAARDERLLNLMLRAQKVALDYRLEETRVMGRAMVEAMSAVSQSVTMLASVYKEQAELAAEIGAAEATLAAKEREAEVAAERGKGSDLDDVFKAAIAQKLLGGEPTPQGSPQS
jgi:hypothetical protein